MTALRAVTLLGRNQLAAFGNEVRAQTGKKLSEAEANALLAGVTALRTKLDCP